MLENQIVLIVWTKYPNPPIFSYGLAGLSQFGPQKTILKTLWTYGTFEKTILKAEQQETNSGDQDIKQQRYLVAFCILIDN